MKVNFQIILLTSIFTVAFSSLMDAGQTVLRILIEHHKLSTADFADEIGDKDMVSLIADGKQPLTVKHIVALSKRFGVSPAAFFDH